MKILYWIAGSCLLGCLTYSASGSNINGEARYISFSVPGSLGTYPMSINASMTVTGYYKLSPTQANGFLREADGTITTFNIPGAVKTVPESIDIDGDIAGFYTLPSGLAQGFLRYAGGRTVTFHPPTPAGVPPPPPALPIVAQPVSINNYHDVAGNYQVADRSAGFFRSASGVYTDIFFPDQFNTYATAINASGTAVGWVAEGEEYISGILWHPDGWQTTFDAPFPILLYNSCDIVGTSPEGINASGAVVGWFTDFTCVTAGFVMSPDGVFATFQVPGTLVASLLPSFTSTDPHWMSIDEAGDVTGSYSDKAGAQHGFVRNPYGTITSFDPPEGKQTTATTINDTGAIAGFYQYNPGGGPPVGFIRVP